MLKKFIRTCLTSTLATSLVTLLAACGGSSGNSSDIDSKHVNRSIKEQSGPYATEVQQLYVAYFGRPADPNGLANFQAALQAAGAPTDIAGLASAYGSNPAVKTLIDSFSTSKESQTLYGSSTTTAFVSAIFQNVLGRQPAAAGLQFWVNAIDSGTLTQSDAALSIMAGAETNLSAQGKIDATLVQNRIAVASYFSASASASIYTGSVAAANARTMLAGVTSTTDVTAYQANVDATVTTINDEHIFESLALQGGDASIGYNIPYGGGNLVSGKNYIFSTSGPALGASPFSAGPQSYTPVATSLDSALSLPGYSYNRVLQNGQIWLQPALGKRVVSYVNGRIHVDTLASDNSTALVSVEYHDFSSISLAGLVNNAPEEFMAALPIRDWIKFNNFTSNAQWQQGASYIKKKANLVGDTYFAEDCRIAASPTYTYTTSPTPCASGTLDTFFPVELGGTSHPFETNYLSDGTISTIQGLRMWVANSPIPLEWDPTQYYRTYFELNGNVYAGYLEKNGTPTHYSQADGSIVDYTITLNQSAVASVQQGIITGATVAGSKQGDSTTVTQTVDLFGIGGHGVNGALSPVDLRTHYNAPANLDGSGQTIAIIDAPGSGSVEADLNVYSQFYNLPSCTTANSCFQLIDMSNGAAIPSGDDWGSELELDTQMVHAMAPGAKIILVTAAANTTADLMAAVKYASTLPGVTAVSMSFRCSDVTSIDAQLQASSNAGMVFFAASGDGGHQSNAQYPAAAQWATAVGGTRINSISSTATNAEAAWQFSGGGISTAFQMPSWQSPLLQRSGFQTSMRATPDVSAVSDPQHSAVVIYYKDHWSMGGGTSVATPIWAGISALFGQYLTNKGQTLPALASKTTGGFNGMLYNLQYAAQYNASTIKASGFYDITQGTNYVTNPGCTICQASSGYDYVTGLGSPNVTALLSNY